MPLKTSAATRTAATAVAAFMLVGCAVADPSTSPGTPGPANATTALEPTADATVEPADQEVFEAQDGAVRIPLPEGWTVDDRSRMHDGSDMYNAGPAWLNDVVVFDSDGNQMLWYSESYGDDGFDCWPVAADFSQPVDPFAPDLRNQLNADAEAAGLPYPVAEIRSLLTADRDSAGMPTGEWNATLDLMSRIQTPEDCGFDQSLWVGNRVVSVSTVADVPGAQAPTSPIVFESEQAAREWLDSDEFATLVDVLASIELTGAPLLDTAP